MILRSLLSLGCLLLCGVSGLGAAPAPVLVKDIQEGMIPSYLGQRLKTAMGNRLFYVGHDWSHGEELWVSDGTEEGTRMVKDVFPGPGFSNITEMVVSGSKLFFTAEDGEHGMELWVSDGTEAGTRIVADLTREPGRNSVPSSLRAYRGGVFFVADSSGNSTALWKSDGTPEGTTLLKVLIKGEPNGAFSFVDLSWLVMGTSLYFTFDDDGFGLEMWKSDGTVAGTVPLTDRTNVEDPKEIHFLAAVGSTLYFSGYTDLDGFTLWKTNGTAEGIQRVKSLATEQPKDARRMVVLGGKGYFLARTDEHGEELWVTNGTEAGTRLLKEQVVGPESSGYDRLEVMNGLLAVAFNPEYERSGVWVYNPAKDQGNLVYWTQVSYGVKVVKDLATVGKQMFFFTAVPGETAKLWVSDGTRLRTRQHSVLPHVNLLPPEMKAASSQMFFSKAVAVDEFGGELWRTDGTDGGLRRVMPLAQGGRHGDPRHLQTAAGALYFAGTDAVSGTELWRSDGTAAGTVRVADISPGAAGSDPKGFCELNGVVYFSADDGSTGAELWRTDGTESGTQRVKDIQVGALASEIKEMRVYKGRLFFQAKTALNGEELWVSDGTEAGTALFANIQPESSFARGSRPRQLTEFDGALYFIASQDGDGWGIRRTEGIPGDVVRVGTVSSVSNSNLLVRPPSPGAALLPDEEVLFFVGWDGANPGLYLCRQGGGGPELVFSLVGHTPSLPMLSGDRVVFVSRSNNLTKIWSSDGTTAGTEAVAEVESAQLVTTVRDKVYYQVSNDATGLVELWCMNTDGGEPRRLMNPTRYFNFTARHVEGETVFFGVYVNAFEEELWQTQGSPETTRRVENVWVMKGADGGISPYGMQRLASRLYFPGYRADVGNELFAVDLQGGLEVTVQRPRPLGLAVADGGAAEMGAQAVGVARVERLRLRNVGVLPLTGVAVSTPALADYGISMTNVGTLASGAAVDVEVTFTPQAAGLRETQIVISGVAEGAFAHEVMLRGEGLDATDAPVLLQGPLPQLVLEGTPVEMTSQFASAVPLNHTWYRGKVAVQEGAETLRLPEVRLVDGGIYTVKVTSSVGSLRSPGVDLAVVARLPTTLNRPEGGPLSLRCLVNAPPTAALTYQWFHQGVPMANVNGASGTHTGHLQISRLKMEDAGEYDCVVTMLTSVGLQTVNAGTTVLTLRELPDVLVPEEGLEHFVEQEVIYQVQFSTEVIRAFASGLPPGLKMDSMGLITGRPTLTKRQDPDTGLPAPYLVKLNATNADGTGETVILKWRIRPLLPAGLYEGLLGRLESLDGGRGLGSLLKVTTTATGTISGQLTLGGKVHRFAKGSLQDGAPLDGSGSLHFQIPLGRDAEPLTLLIKAENESFQASLMDEQGGEVVGMLYPQAFGAKVPAVDLAGRYTWLMEPESQPPGDEDIPNAAGYMTATISKTGVVTWRGKMADGTVVTGSSPLLQELGAVVFALHKELYVATGSVQGWMRLQGDGADGSLVELGGQLDWRKAALAEGSKVRLYKQGIPLHYLMVTGGSYRLPEVGERVIQLGEGLGNASFTLSGWSVVGESLGQMFTVTEKNAVRLPKLSAETPLRSLSLSLSLGTFKGTLVLTDDHPLDGKAKPLKRTVAFEGVIVYPQTRAEGFGLVPQLPEAGPPETSLATSKIHACKVLLGPGTGLPD